MQPAEKTTQNYVHYPKWATGISRLVKAHMAASGTTYNDLSKMLKQLGTSQSPENLRVKINRGNLGAQLFVQLLIVMGKSEINLRELETIVRKLDV